MKVCIPVQENKDLESTIYNHFGSAPYFLIYDLEKEEIKFIQNGDLHHAHGMCQPLKALGGENINAIMVEGIGAGALNKLNNEGIKVFKAADASIAKNIELLRNNKLEKFSLENSCNHHGCNH